MRLGRIALLWAVAAVLGAVHLAEERRPALPAPEPALEVTRLIDVDEAEVSTVRLVDGPVAMRLARRGEEWSVVEPEGAVAPGDLVRAFVESLFAAVVLQAATPAASDPREFGLDERRRIELELLDGARRVFVLGGETPTGTAAYVRDGSGAVRVIGRNALVYRDLLLGAIRAPRETEPPLGPVASRH